MFVFGNDLLSETGATSVPYLDSPTEWVGGKRKRCHNGCDSGD
jgi:hypothetical protein